jgi:hypothetical protein
MCSIGIGCQEQALENGEIEPFVLEREGELTFEARIGGVMRRVDTPAVRLDQPDDMRGVP